MSLNKLTDSSVQKTWMNIGCNSLVVDGVSIEGEKIYSYNISPGSVGLEVWKIIETTNGLIYARFSGSRNYEIATGITNPTVEIDTPPAFYDKYNLSTTGPVGIISATMSPFGSSPLFGVSSYEHVGNTIRLFFTSDSGGVPRPSIVSFDILYPVTLK